MKLGTEDRNKVIILGVLALGAAYAVYDNVLSGPSSAPQTPSPLRRNADLDIATSPLNAPSASSQAQSTRPRPLVKRNSRGDEFHPVLRNKNARPDVQQVNLTDIDPTIHFELLAKVQNMKLEGGQRNLFQFGAPPAAEVKPLAGEEPKIAMGKPYIFPKPDPPKVEPPPPAPPPPPTPPSFKYYGLATKRINNKKTAFFLDGEEIIFAIEGMTVKSKWRVIRIGAESVMLEDTQTKKQQPLTLSEDAGGTS
jgi:hypothetical protein